MSTTDVFKVNWYGGGYFDLIEKYVDCNFEPEDKQVMIFVESLKSSLSGNFEKLEDLVDVIHHVYPSHLGSACCALIGCAGNRSLIDRIYEDRNFRISSDSIDSLAFILVCSARLKDVENLFELYLETKKGKDDWYTAYPSWISDIIDQEQEILDLYYSNDEPAFEKKTAHKIADLRDAFGGEMHVHGGLPVSKGNLKKSMSEKVKRGTFIYPSRIRLEAYFGVDCTKSYTAKQDIISDNMLDLIDGLEDDERGELGEKYFFRRLIS